jgi:hypothetical protein
MMNYFFYSKTDETCETVTTTNDTGNWDKFVRFGVSLGNPFGPKEIPVFPKNWKNLTESINMSKNPANFAVLTGKINDIIVIDVDFNKNGLGLETFEKYFGKIEELNTLVTQSWNGGYHVFFKYNPDIKNSRALRDLNIDIHSDGRCVFQGRNYPVVCDKPIQMSLMNYAKVDTGFPIRRE